MKSFTTTIQKFILTVFCLFLFNNNAFSQCMGIVGYYTIDDGGGSPDCSKSIPAKAEANFAFTVEDAAMMGTELHAFKSMCAFGNWAPDGWYSDDEVNWYYCNAGRLDALPTLCGGGGGGPPESYDCDGAGNCSDPGDGSGAYADLLSCQAACPTPPSITKSTSSISGLTSCSGSAGSSQSFTVSGSNLTGNLQVTESSNYIQISQDNSTWVSTINLVPSGGSVSTTTIYVRIPSGVVAGAFSSQNITISTSGASSETVACAGTVNSPAASITAGMDDATINYGAGLTLSPTISGCASGGGTPLSEGFEVGALPINWTFEYVSGTNKWKFEDGAGYTTPSSAYSGDYNALLYASRGSVTKLITPALDLSSYTKATLTFYHAQTNWGGDQDELRIYYKTSAAGPWKMILGAEWTSEVSSWTQRTVALPSLSSTYYIAFEGTSDYGHGVVIDEVEVSGTAPTCTYSWTTTASNGHTATTASTTVSGSATSNDAGTYTLVVTDPNGCTTTDNVTISVCETVSPTIAVTETSGSSSNDGTTCSGDAVTLASSCSGCGTISSYSWDNSGGSSSSASYAPTSTTTYTITVTNNCGNSGTASQAITVNSNPSISGLVNQTLNDGDNLAFSISTSGCGAASYQTENIGSGNYGTSRSSFTETPGGFWQNVSGDDDSWYGESNSTTSGSTGPDGPNSGDDYIFIEASSGYAYSSGDIVYLESDAITETGIQMTFYYHMYGSDMGTLEVESYDGSSWTSRWSKSGQQHVSESASWTQASVDMSSYTVTKLRFKYTAAGGYKGDAALDDIVVTKAGCTYAWTGPNSFSSSIEDPTVTASVSNIHAGTYNLTLTNNSSCTATGSATVSISCPTPSVSITGTDNSGTANNDGSVCSGDAVTMDAGSHTSYSWSSGETSQTISKTAGGTYTVTVTNSCGTTNTASYTVTENNNPTASISGDASYCSGNGPVTWDGGGSSAGSGTISSYSWEVSSFQMGTGSTYDVSLSGSYDLIVTNSNGCTNSTSKSLTINSNPSASITNNDGTTELTCSQTTISLTGNGGTSFSWSGGNNPGWKTNTMTSAGTYTVTVTDGNGCTDTESITLTSNTTAPTAGITNNDGTTELTCTQTAISVTATGGGTYSWDNSLGANASQSLTSAGTYNVTVTGSNGCTDNTSITLTSNTTAPTAGITNNSGTIELTCSQTSISLTATGGGTYSWSNSLGTNATVSITSPGTYSVKVTGSNGCTDNEDITITQDISTPTASITNNDGTTELNCSQTAISVTATGGSSYSWDNSLGTNASQSLTSAGTYNVTVTASNGCTDNTSVTLTSNTTAPTAGITNNDAVTELTCTQTSISLTATGGGTYSWSNGGSTANTSPTSPNTYTVTVTGSNGCTDTESITLTQDISTPTASITNNDGTTVLTCSQTAISVTASGGSSYSWDNSLGTNASQSLTSAGTYSVTVTGSNGCTDNTSISLTSNTTAPTASITNNDGTTELTCSQTSISLTASGGSSYSWSNGGSTANTSPTSAGTYTVTVTGSNGCTDNTSVTLTSNTTAPSAGITNNTGSSTITCTTTSISVSATGGGTYSWDNSLGTSANQTLSSAGTYSVTVTGSNGCTDNTSITISSNTTVPTVTASSSASSVCDGTSVTLTGGGANTYSWDNSVSNGVAFTPSTTTTYTVTGTNTTNGCTNTATTTVTVNNNPSPTISVTETSGGSNNDGILCSGDAATLDAGSYSSYSWSTGETSQTISKSTTATYTVTVTDGNGCTGSDNQTITSNANPLVSPSASPASISSGSSSNLLANASGGSSPYSYSWDNGGSLNSTTTSNPVATPTTTTTYSVTVSDNNSCEVSGSVTVSVATGTVTWVGGTSTDWNTASNWDVGGVPSSSNDVVIPAGTANICYTPTASNASVNSLTINSSAILVVQNTSASNTKLTVTDHMTINGTLTQTGDADIVLNGTSKTLTIGGSATTTSARLSISGSYSLSGNIIATNVEVQSGGSFTVNANDVRTYSFTQDGTYTMTTGNLYIEGSTASFTDANFVEGTGHVYIGNSSGTSYYSSGPTSVTVTSGVDFYDLTLNTNNGVEITMGTGLGSYSVGGDINLLNPGTAGGTITTKDAILVSGNLNYQTSGNGLTLKLYDRLYRPTGTGTFTMGSSTDNSICVYYSSGTYEAISGFGSGLDYVGTTCLLASGQMLLSATDFDNLTINNAGALAILSNNVTITGDLTVTSGDLNLGSNEVTLSGDLNVSGGSLTMGTSTVKMVGSSAQTITTNGSDLYNLDIVNTKAAGTSITLGSDVTVSNILKLSDGIVQTTSSYTLFVDDNRVNAIVGDDGTVNSLDAASFVWGKLKRTVMNGSGSGNNTYVFPVGQQYNGATQPKYYRSDVTLNDVVTTSNITVGFTEGAHPAYTSSSDFLAQGLSAVVPSGSTGFTMKEMLTEGYWTITPNSQPTGGDYDVIFYHNTFDDMGTSGKIGIVKCPEGSTSITDWTVAGTLAADNSGFRKTEDGKLKVTGLTSFSDFGGGNGGGNPLPIELISFDVTMSSGRAVITWTTATEIDNDYFTVERTLDGVNFEDVLQMAGAGNSFSPITYIAYDENPLPGTSYYRLRQTDYNGGFVCSGLVELYNPYISNVNDFTVTKNGDEVIVDYILAEPTDFDLYLYDMMGRVVSKQSAASVVGENRQTINVGSLGSGAYFVTLMNKSDVHSEKIVITR